MLNKSKIVSGIIITLSVLTWLFWPSAKKYSDGKIHLRYWFATGQKEEIPFAVKLFNRTQDSIVVEAVPIPWQESEKKILTAILSENPPDVIDQFVPVVKWASRMALVPLDSLIKHDRFDTSVVFPALWEEMKYQNHIFAIPVYTASYAFFYNKRLFREAGLDPEKPPKTWSEVQTFSKRLIQKDKKGHLTRLGFIYLMGRALVLSQQTIEPSLLMAWQKRVPFINKKEDKVVFANPKMVEIFNWILQAQNEYKLDEFFSFTAGFGYGDQHGFISERVAMQVLSNTFPENIARYNPELDYGVALVPTFEGYPTASSSGSWWRAISRGAKNIKAAWQFIKFTIQKDIQLKSIKATKENLFPANRLAASDRTFLKDKTTEIFLKQMDYAHSPTIIPMAHDVFWREYYSALERIMRGIQKPMEALQQAQETVQHNLDQAIKYDRYVRTRMNFQEVY